MDSITFAIIILLSNCITITVLLTFSKIRRLESEIKRLEKNIDELKDKIEQK